MTDTMNRAALILECNRLCRETGGPGDFTFNATSTAALHTIRDELRAMKAGEPIDGFDPRENPFEGLKFV